MAIEHKKRGRKPRNKNIPHGNLDNSTQKLYAMAVDKFFHGITNKDDEFRILTKDEERKLIDSLRNDRQELENQLVKHNIFLAISYASKQQYRYTDFDELISLAMYGLREAAQNFNIDSGWRFNTYAMWHLRKQVLKKFYVKKEYMIENNTSIFIDSDKNQCGDDNDCDFAYGVLNSQIEPSVLYRYKTETPSEKIDNDSRNNYIHNIVNQIIESVETSSLSTVDKKVFNMTFIENDNIKTISKELGIKPSDVTISKKRVLSYINSNFSKAEIFSNESMKI